MHEIGLGAVAKPSPLTQFPVDRDNGHECHAYGCQVSQSAGAVGPVRIDECRGVGQFAGHLMVIEHDDVDSRLARQAQGLVCRDAAIHGHHRTCTPLLQGSEGIDARSVSLLPAIGNMDHRFRADAIKVTHEKGRRRGAIDIVVAEDTDRLSRFDGIRDAPDGARHVDHAERIGHQVLHAGFEKSLDVIGLHAPGRQKAGQDFRQVETLRQSHDGIIVTKTVIPVQSGT